MVCVFYRQVQGLGARWCPCGLREGTKWLLLLEGVLGEPGSLGHFMSTASAQTKDGTLLFSPAFLSQVISRMDKVVLRWSETWDSQAA